jgi:hypothetical protein
MTILWPGRDEGFVQQSDAALRVVLVAMRLDSRPPQAGEFAVRYAIPATYKLRWHATAGYPRQSNGRATGTSDAN